MIKELKITNFYSIKETQTISFAINKKDMLDESSFISPCGNMLNSIIAIIGNNASGKTNMLKGLSFLVWFVNNSYQTLGINSKIPTDPHKLSKEPYSAFELIFEQDNKEYQYKIKLDSKSVLYEFLGIKKERGYSYIYEIDREQDKVTYAKWDLAKFNDNDKERFEQRPNSSLFSFLLSTGHLPAIGIKKFINMKTNLNNLGRVPNDTSIMMNELSKHLEDKDRKDTILKYIKEFGFGIDDFEMEDIDWGINANQTNEQSFQNTQKMKILKITHKTQEDSFKLSFLDESNGTQGVIYLLNCIYPVLENGGILVYDEIENSIHPYIIKKLINLLANYDTNPKHAQLIFSTHQPWLLDDRTKTQIYLTEKNTKMETDVFRLDDVEGVRNDDNFCNKYLSGAYGGVADDVRWF